MYLKPWTDFQASIYIYRVFTVRLLLDIDDNFLEHGIMSANAWVCSRPSTASRCK